jgi:signal transduction histidine kinase
MTTSVLTSAASARPIEARLAPARAATARTGLTGILRVPLLGKIIGANLVLALAAIVGHAVFPDTSMATQLGIVLGLSFVVSSVLAWIALRPLAQLEHVAERVSQGDFAARVSDSPIADRNIARLSTTVNRLLERVESDRARIQYLAGRSVRARDIERDTIARELRDSLAQMVAAIGMQVSAARGMTDDSPLTEQLDLTRDLVQQLGDEMRSVAETLYPGTLGEFGLLNALSALGRITSRRSNVRVDFEAGPFDALLSPAAAAALYRVAEEALRNIAQHASATCARMTLRAGVDFVLLEIEDDGRGIDLRLNDPMQAGLGLFSARAVLALVEGELQISSAPGKGTRVLARAPKATG